MNERLQRVIVRATMIVAFALAAVAANSALASQKQRPTSDSPRLRCDFQDLYDTDVLLASDVGRSTATLVRSRRRCARNVQPHPRGYSRRRRQPMVGPRRHAR